MEEKPITLETLNGGAAVEMFNAELRRVLANIEDLNTAPKSKRLVTLKVSIVPDETRRMGGMEVSVTSKLAAPRANPGVVFFGRINGEPVAVQNDPAQGKLFDQKPAPEAGVKLVSMRKDGGANVG